jgi:hypothetical protein
MLVGGFAMIVSASNGIVLAFNISVKYSNHANFRRQWIAVLAEASMEENEIVSKGLAKTFHRLNAEEPPVSKRQINKSFDETKKAMGLET